MKNTEKSKDFKNIFVIESNANGKFVIVNRTLILKLADEKSNMKYECLLNGNETIRSHFIEIISLKPEIELKIQKNELNKLRLSFLILDKTEQNRFQNLDLRPLKLSILYSENSTINGAQVTYIAPGMNYFSIKFNYNKNSKRNTFENNKFNN